MKNIRDVIKTKRIKNLDDMDKSNPKESSYLKTIVSEAKPTLLTVILGRITRNKMFDYEKR